MMLRYLRTYLIFLVISSQAACGQVGSTGEKKPEKSAANRQAARLDSLKYIPQPGGMVNDYIHLFTEEQAKMLTTMVTSYEKKTSTEIVVAIIDSSYLGPIDFNAYALLMLRTWGVGKKEKNNGILILIVRDLRKIRIENGYGIERQLSNQETAAILDTYILPRFREGKFYEGTQDGILAIIDKLEQPH